MSRLSSTTPITHLPLINSVLLTFAFYLVGDQPLGDVVHVIYFVNIVLCSFVGSRPVIATTAITLVGHTAVMASMLTPMSLLTGWLHIGVINIGYVGASWGQVWLKLITRRVPGTFGKSPTIELAVEDNLASNVLKEIHTAIHRATTDDHLLEIIALSLMRYFDFERILVGFIQPDADDARWGLVSQSANGQATTQLYSAPITNDVFQRSIECNEPYRVTRSSPESGPDDFGQFGYAVVPLSVPITLSNSQRCWDMVPCNQAECPARQQPHLPCWMMPETCCRHVTRDVPFATKLDYCNACPVYQMGHQQQVIGFLAIDHGRRPRPMSETEYQQLMSIAAEISPAISNVRLMRIERDEAARLDRANQQLAEAARRQTAMIQNLSHELRTPLTFVIGYANLMHEQTFGPLNARQAEVLLSIEHKAKRLAEILSDITLLASSDPIALLKVPVGIAELIKDIGGDLNKRSELKSYRFLCEAEANLPAVTGDPQLLRVALEHILSNAVKFSPHGGLITLTAHTCPLGVEIRITDEGIGISPDQLPEIFEPFVQGDSSTTRHFGGLGLGLAVSRLIAQAHDGTIEVIPNLKQGITVRLLLPVIIGVEAKNFTS
jgi:signal transduction histidine kinase